MKKIFVFFALAATMLVACTKEQPDGTVVRTVLTIGSAETKTTVGDVENDGTNDFRRLFWADGDQVNANGVASLELENVPAGTTRTDFSFSGTVTAPYNVVYPASIYKDASTVSLLHNVGDQVIPMGGVSETTSFSLNPLTGILQLKIKQAASNPDTDHIVLIEVSTASTRMSGDFTINYSTGVITPAASPAGNDLAVQITGDWALSSSETSFFIPVPAGNYNFTVKVMDKKGHFMTKSTTTPKSFAQGVIQPLKAFEFVPSATDGIEIDTPEKLIAFAQAYNNGDFQDLDKDLVATVTANLSFDATTSAAFNATGGIGAGGSSDPMFNGVFDGGNHTISGLTATVPLFARVGKNGTVKNVKMGSSSSLTYSAAISANTYLGAIAGYCKGNITDCTNNAAVTCSSTTRSGGVIYLGGVVARQNGSGVISGCENTAAVTCSTLVGSSNVYVGGIAGSVERPGSADTANILNCTNRGAVYAGVDANDPAQAFKLYAGGVVGWIYSTPSSAKMTITGLENFGNITKTNNNAKANSVPILLGGIVAGVHGATLTAACGEVAFEECHVKNCTVQNGGFNNTLDYDKAHHTAGFVGVALGENAGDISCSSNCYVKNVNVITRRGIGGGFASMAQGATLDGCEVIASAVKGSLAQLPTGGGLVGLLQGNSTLTDCIVTLTKDSNYSLFGAADSNNGDVALGGLVGKTLGTNSISDCKVFVSLMYVGTTKTENHGWIVGNDGGTTTIEDCGWGGTYGNGTPTTTLSGDNYLNYTVGAGSPSMEGTNYYWDAGDAPAGITSVTIVISEYATSHSWVSGTDYPQTVEQGGITLQASNTGSNQNGAYTNPQWRFYQARGGGLTVSAPAGHSLVSATFTYAVQNTGILLAPDGTTQIASGTKYQFSGETSALFTLGNTAENVTNGQCRFTKFVIEYN